MVFEIENHLGMRLKESYLDFVSHIKAGIVLL